MGVLSFPCLLACFFSFSCLLPLDVTYPQACPILLDSDTAAALMTYPIIIPFLSPITYFSCCLPKAYARCNSQVYQGASYLSNQDFTYQIPQQSPVPFGDTRRAVRRIQPRISPMATQKHRHSSYPTVFFLQHPPLHQRYHSSSVSALLLDEYCSSSSSSTINVYLHHSYHSSTPTPPIHIFTAIFTSSRSSRPCLFFSPQRPHPQQTSSPSNLHTTYALFTTFRLS